MQRPNKAKEKQEFTQEKVPEIYIAGRESTIETLTTKRKIHGCGNTFLKSMKVIQKALNLI